MNTSNNNNVQNMVKSINHAKIIKKTEKIKRKKRLNA